MLDQQYSPKYCPKMYLFFYYGILENVADLFKGLQAPNMHE